MESFAGGLLQSKPSQWLSSLLAPNRDAALKQYGGRARVYDLELALLEPIRRIAIERLHLQRGQTAIDVGCGTGLSFSMLEEKIGPAGRIIAIEQSPAMIERAQSRMLENRWQNLTLLNSPVETAPLDDSLNEAGADAALFHFTHDIMRTREALELVTRHLKPGATVVASGLKWAPPWAMAANLFILPAALRSVTSLGGMREPWNLLATMVPDLEVEQFLAGGVYVASSNLRRN